jgi:hypothetical protein
VVGIYQNLSLQGGWACSTYTARRGAPRVLVGKPVEKKPLGRPRRRWEDNIKMHLQEKDGRA